MLFFSINTPFLSPFLASLDRIEKMGDGCYGERGVGGQQVLIADRSPQGPYTQDWPNFGESQAPMGRWVKEKRGRTATFLHFLPIKAIFDREKEKDSLSTYAKQCTTYIRNEAAIIIRLIWR